MARLRSHVCSEIKTDRSGEIERVRAAQLQAERLLEAREQSHRQQVLRLENQVFKNLPKNFTKFLFLLTSFNFSRFNFYENNLTKK